MGMLRQPSSPNRVIFLVDVQSFFASIEKTLDPSLKGKPIVVAGDPERRSGVILAACPLAKKWGVKTAETLWEAQQKCPIVTVVKPHMQKYIDLSVQLTNMLHNFTDLVEPYSIDEQFMDVTPTLHLFGSDPWSMARLVQDKVKKETGVYVRIGIGPNKVLAKMACDNWAKKSDTGLAQISRENLSTTLWPLPVEALFGVGRRMKRHLESMGIRTIGQLAQTPVERLTKKWGINGKRLWLTANGIDDSPVSPRSHDGHKAIGQHMTLPRDYETKEQIKVILLELCEEVGRRARLHGYVGNTISVGVRGADLALPNGFHRQMKLPETTNDGLDMFKAAWRLFNTYWDGEPVRSAGVTLSGLESDRYRQLSLLDSTWIKKERLSRAVDALKEKYGPAAILRAASLTVAGQARDRAQKIGGHYK